MKKSINYALITVVVIAIVFYTQIVQAQWSLTGNGGTTPGTNFVGTTDANALYFKTQNSTRLVITSAGKVGIVTTSPTAKLQIEGTTNTSQLIIDAYSGQTNSQPLIRLRNSAGT